MRLYMFLGDFFYFPEDKTEYIPAAFNMVLFLVLAIFVFRLIKKISAKEALKAELLEQQLYPDSNKNEDKK